MKKCYKSKPATHMYHKSLRRMSDWATITFVKRDGLLKMQIFVFFAKKDVFFTFEVLDPCQRTCPMYWDTVGPFGLINKECRTHLLYRFTIILVKGRPPLNWTFWRDRKIARFFVRSRDHSEIAFYAKSRRKCTSCASVGHSVPWLLLQSQQCRSGRKTSSRIFPSPGCHIDSILENRNNIC